MFSTPILDIAIGLSFIYLLLGLICSTVNEMIAAKRKTRAKFLDKGIQRLLGDDGPLKSQLYNHPLIKSLAPSDQEICPSYIPAERFSKALMDILSGEGKPPTDINALIAGTKGLASESARTALQALIDSGHDNPALIRQNIEDWFNQNMDRVSGWYKRNAQFTSAMLAIAVTLVLNADTLHVSQVLWANPAIRAAVSEEVKIRASKQPTDDALTDSEKALLGELNGWDPEWRQLQRIRAEKKPFNLGLSDVAGWFGKLLYNHILGWILTAIAVSLGAPFWFDTLNKFMNVRNAGRAPDETPKNRGA